MSITDCFNNSKRPKILSRSEKHDLVVQKTTEWIAMDLLPVSTVESKWYRTMMTASDSHIKPISRKCINKTMKLTENEIRSYIINLVKTEDPWISITVDHWTSIASQNYTGMTAHWIGKECKLHNLQLGCWLHEGNSESMSLVDDFISKIFNTCKLSEAKIVCVVSDTTGSMNRFGVILESQNIPHIYCSDHVLQLTAKQAFNDDNYQNLFQSVPVYLTNGNASDKDNNRFVLMKKCRSLVEVFTTSTQKMEKLLKIQQSMNVYNGKVPVKTIQDVVTRWWSTYTMLDRLAYLKPAITALVADHVIPEEYILSASEWHTIVKIIDILKPFKTAQKYLEGENYVTISWIPHMIKNIHKKLEESLHLATDPDDQNDNVKYLVERLIFDFEKRWFHDGTLKFHRSVIRGQYNRQIGIHPFVSIATALDPRFKNLYIYDNETERENVWKEIHLLMVEVAKKLSRPYEESSTEIVRNVNKIHTIDSDIEDLIDEIERNHNSYHQLANRSENTTTNDNHFHDVCSIELESYKKMVSLPICKSDNLGNKCFTCPLKDFWLAKKDQFPIIYNVAMKYLCIPATSAPSERVFSVTSKIISKFCNRISDENVGTILFVHGNLEWYLNETK